MRPPGFEAACPKFANHRPERKSNRCRACVETDRNRSKSGHSCAVEFAVNFAAKLAEALGGDRTEFGRIWPISGQGVSKTPRLDQRLATFGSELAEVGAMLTEADRFGPNWLEFVLRAPTRGPKAVFVLLLSHCAPARGAWASERSLGTHKQFYRAGLQSTHISSSGGRSGSKMLCAEGGG